MLSKQDEQIPKYCLQSSCMFYILLYPAPKITIMHIDKLVISNRSVLLKKYGNSGLTKVQSAIKKMISNDKKRQVKTMFVFLDDSQHMKRVKGKQVTDSTDAEQNKNAIDSFARYYRPDYFLLLGAPDVIPHCKFKIAIPGDDDAFVPSDVPYACEAAFSRNAGDFIAPARVLGRLPDLAGSNDVSSLLKLVDNAVKWKPLKATEYNNYFSLSVKWWEKSTRLSLDNIFQDNSKLKMAPPSLKDYTKKELGARMHFFNCHGGLRTPEFYGQPNGSSSSYPVCYHTDMLKNSVSFGTVIAAECCYGAHLYNALRPTLIPQPICNTYLLNGALAFLGSTTAAYGPADSQGAADYITQYFLIAIRKGASSGRAFLEAQQRFVEKGDVKMDPMDLKTIIQFILLGDPSLSPVEEPQKENSPKNPVSSIVNRSENELRERKERREKMSQKAVFINAVSDTPVKISTTVRGTVKKEIDAVLKHHNFNNECTLSYGFKKRQAAQFKKAGAPSDYKYHLYSCLSAGPVVDTLRVLVIQEVDNKVLEVKEYVRR
ncbi:MAG: hypothetical protein JWQ27_2563 [Ferruginibacter sp.]|nr:hypothetical protein [Ferruginibacter sp.]